MVHHPRCGRQDATACFPWDRLLPLGLGVLGVSWSSQVVLLWLRVTLIASTETYSGVGSYVGL